MKMKTKKKGFTLIELLVCLFIIGLMMLLIIPNIAKQRESAQEKSNAAIVRVVKAQQQAYMIDLKTNDIPTLEQLKEKGYINDSQVDAYNKAPQNLKDEK
ncbi:MAG: prepilin-type N-terminal cleavage/methylation domain-containing protein [Streptococcus sp.]|nr:prepilin-type N-terminal cleavage/methylation domain-containing protein [Streptococcus sp.]